MSAALAQRVVATPMSSAGHRSPVPQRAAVQAAARLPPQRARAGCGGCNGTEAVRDGKVQNVTAKEAGALMKEGWVLLDVRPPQEIANAKLVGAVEVPLFVVDSDMSPAGLLKQASNFGMGGWWLGGAHMKPNPQFMAEVQASVPKDTPVVVACQKGLRSLAACEPLSRAGYGPLAWINGGFDTAQPGDLPTKDGADIRLGGVGGLSGILGWTEAQREATRTEGFAGGAVNIIKVLAVLLVIDLVWFGYEVATDSNVLTDFFGSK
ncbi:Rhodanese-like domain-containing protein 11 [Chlorella vulgaris]